VNEASVLMLAAPASSLSDQQLRELLHRPVDPDEPDAVPCRGDWREADDWTSPPFDLVDDETYAERLCRGCPLRAVCLEYALRWWQEGIWGGVGPRDRAAAIRHRRTTRDDGAAAESPAVDGPDEAPWRVA
jgi:hypothetical protein